ncbi:MAG: YqgE/AlgH family protein [Solirubrobacterales bacterium]
MSDSLSGSLLIASPRMGDWFQRAVVLVVEHTEQGAFGLVLNRPSDATVGEAAPGLGELIGAEHRLHVGGPVAPEAITAIGEHLDPAASVKLVVDAAGMVDLDDPPELGRLRVFAGYAGWSEGQLDVEVDAEAWIVETALPDDLFEEDDELWSRVLRRKGGEFALLAQMPADPSLN